MHAQGAVRRILGLRHVITSNVYRGTDLERGSNQPSAREQAGIGSLRRYQAPFAFHWQKERPPRFTSEDRRHETAGKIDCCYLLQLSNDYRNNFQSLRVQI